MMKTLFSMVVLLASVAVAGEPDVSSLYDVRTEGTSTNLAAGGKGAVVISIVAKNGAHVSDEAPLRIELSSKQATLEKEKLTLADSVVKHVDGGAQYPDPRFEVGFTPKAPGALSIDAKLTFFICTDKICARQTKTLSLPVTVK